MDVKRALGESINKLTTANQSAGWVPVITRSFHNIGSQLLGRDCSHDRGGEKTYKKLAGAVKNMETGTNAEVTTPHCNAHWSKSKVDLCAYALHANCWPSR